MQELKYKYWFNYFLVKKNLETSGRVYKFRTQYRQNQKKYELFISNSIVYNYMKMEDNSEPC